MIKKERLEELLEQGATIYEAYPDGIDKINLANTAHYDYLLAQQELKIQKIEFEYLHETKEDAEFFREFGFIEKPLKLNLPRWEEFKKLEFYTEKAKIIFCKRIESCLKLPVFEEENYEVIEIWETTFDGENSCHYHELATKENYILACRKCKELFLGDENE